MSKKETRIWVDAFSRNYANMAGATDEVVHELVSKFILQHLKAMNKQKSNFFLDAGHGSFDTFMHDFREEFLEVKLKKGGGFKCLSGLPNDLVVEIELRKFISQFYSQFTMKPETAAKISALDDVLEKLENFGFIRWERLEREKKFRRISPVGKLDFDEIIIRMTAQLQNNNDKRAVLLKVINKLNAGEIVIYAHLYEEVTYVETVYSPKKSGNVDGEEDEDISNCKITRYDQEGNNNGVEQDNIEEPGGDTDDDDDEEEEEPAGVIGIEINFGDGAETQELCASISKTINPVDTEDITVDFPNGEELLRALTGLPDQIVELGETILENCNTDDLNFFMLFWLVRGKPWEKGDGIGDLGGMVGIAPQRANERINRVVATLRCIRDNDESDFEPTEVLLTLLMFYKVYKRKCVVV